MTSPLPPASGSYLATVELWRRPDGSIASVLRDMPKHVIEAGESSAERMRCLAEWMKAGATHARSLADEIGPVSDTPASADMTEHGDNLIVRAKYHLDHTPNGPTRELIQQLVRALASARAEGVKKLVVNEERSLLTPNPAPHAAAPGLSPFITMTIGPTPPAAETGRGQETTATVVTNAKDCIVQPSPDDADAKGRECVKWLRNYSVDIGEEGSIEGDAAARHADEVAAWIEARLRSTPPPSADDAKARELADEIERRGLKFADMVMGEYEMPSGEEHDLIISRLRTHATPTTPTSAGEASDLAELFAPGQLVAVQTYAIEDVRGPWRVISLDKLRGRQITDAERELIYALLSPQPKGPDNGPNG